ncbi:MAG: hypothetical protein HYU64_02100 [Armatimonadetes bacterium]|nr:hypothetical protein [Armatimonadota bacterium]
MYPPVLPVVFRPFCASRESVVKGRLFYGIQVDGARSCIISDIELPSMVHPDITHTDLAIGQKTAGVRQGTAGAEIALDEIACKGAVKQPLP